MKMNFVTNVLRRICYWIYSVGKAYGQQSKRRTVDEMISCQDVSRPIFSEPYTIVGGGEADLHRQGLYIPARTKN